MGKKRKNSYPLTSITTGYPSFMSCTHAEPCEARFLRKQNNVVAINNFQFFTGDGQFFFTGVTSIKYLGVVLDEKWKWKMHVNSFLLKLVITKGYGVRATTIERENAFAPALCFA